MFHAASEKEIYFKVSDILVNIFATNNQSCVFDASASEIHLIYFRFLPAVAVDVDVGFVEGASANEKSRKLNAFECQLHGHIRASNESNIQRIFHLKVGIVCNAPIQCLSMLQLHSDA